jgi:ABC-type transport system involved in multi-copper enzyme maturation permease subunit
MLPGPVFTFEMMMTARRGRLYAVRAFYATVLLLILWTVHSSWKSAYEGEVPNRMVPFFGLSTFGGIAVGQELLILLLTPALVAGAIADEKRRKTLHYLLASRLTGPEIVLGKLMVRMLYVGVLLGVSLPVMSLLVLLGGLDPMFVLVVCGGLLSTAWFLATLSIWVSTIARRPREALFVTYGLEALWLVVPRVVTSSLSTGWGWLDDPLHWLAEWIEATSPVTLVWDLFYGVLFGGGADWVESLCWMIGLQAAAGVMLALLAAVQLRPIFKRQDGAVARPRGLRALLGRRRLRSHPPVSVRPMLWKELHTGGARGFARIVGWLLTLVLGGLLLYYATWYALMAYEEVRQYGYEWNGGWQAQQYRWRFYSLLTLDVPFLYLVGLLTVAGAAASSISSEHEDDTWTSVTSTDLTGREIVLAKLCGSLWRARRLGAVLALLIMAGVGVGSLHYLSLPALVLAIPVYGWFAAALGVWISLQLRSTWRAQFLTIALLLLINVAGQGIVNMLSRFGIAPQVWPGFTPYEVAKFVMDPHFFLKFQGVHWPRFWRLWDIDDGPAWLAIFSILSLIGYTILATLLTLDALRRFEIVAGRARRGRVPAAMSTEGPSLGQGSGSSQSAISSPDSLNSTTCPADAIR